MTQIDLFGKPVKKDNDEKQLPYQKKLYGDRILTWKPMIGETIKGVCRGERVTTFGRQCLIDCEDGRYLYTPCHRQLMGELIMLEKGMPVEITHTMIEKIKAKNGTVWDKRIYRVHIFSEKRTI